MADAAAVIARLEAELSAAPKATSPYEHALLAHRLGIAYAESASGDTGRALQRALACFDEAAELLDPRFHPVEHARVLTAAGSARRSLGDAASALRLFARAQALAAGRVGANEAAAVANNVGLALLDLGQHGRAVAQFDEALERFDSTTPDGRRGRASALHNRGLARAAAGGRDDLVAAVADHQRALEAVGQDEAPLHHGLVRHSLGVTAAELAASAQAVDDAARWRAVAIDAFVAALEVFVWPEHRMAHGIASFNLGRMYAAGGACEQLQRATVHFEDAVTAFDPRHQRPQWSAAHDALVAVEERLAVDLPGRTRTDHFVALLDSDPEAAPRLMRRRLSRWLSLPPAARDVALGELVDSVVRADAAVGPNALVLILSTVMELPVVAQGAVLDALITARRAADEDRRDALDRLVDRAVGEAVVGPQRVVVRDHLVEGGFERP